MAVTDKTANKKNIAIILAVLGIILMSIGLVIVRGSGWGIVSIISGLVLLVFGGYLIYAKPKA
ncbi:hypothetical protein [Methanocella paludicola]|uniref:hypothetical protein n=1 Tax=Methanocella paludicola TaxID=570267 RepID=UPI00100827F4|nr:hypothetical protein [Methanocella paludicola]